MKIFKNPKNLKVLIGGIFIISLFFNTPVSAIGTKKIGEACTGNSQCSTDLCEDSFCTCDDKGNSGGSAHCAATYNGTASDWRCIDDSEDTTKSHGDYLNFCQRTSFSGAYPEHSTDDVKYPQERKAYMGEACDDDVGCFTDSYEIGGTSCEPTIFDSSPDKNNTHYDPWYAPGKKLKVCECGGSFSSISGLCAAQYGGTEDDWPIDKTDPGNQKSACVDAVSSELQGLLVCKRSDGWTPGTLTEMKKNIGGSATINQSTDTKTSIFGITATVPEIKLVTPTPKIGIPGVVFTNITKESNITTDESGASWLNVPFLGEYISAIYKYSVGLISLIAVLVLIVSGVQIVTSAGNSEAISAAKHRIISSVIAIVLTAGSYTILYTINPELVNLKNLKILVVPQKTFEIPKDESGATIPEADVESITSAASASPGAAPVTGDPYVCGNRDKGSYDNRREDCRLWCASHTDKSTWPQYVKGNLLESETQRGLNAPGIRTASNNVRIPNSMIEPLKKVGLAAQNYPGGPYTIQINDGWRPLARAIEYVCQKFVDADALRAEGKSIEADKKIKSIGPVLSFPGANAHNIATGGAVDVLLLDSSGKQVVRNDWFGYYTQTNPSKAQAVKILAEIFYSVPGWQRYMWEIWHFDYNSTASLRTNTCTKPIPEGSQTCPQ